MFSRLGDSVLHGLHRPSCLAERCCFSQPMSTLLTACAQAGGEIIWLGWDGVPSFLL